MEATAQTGSQLRPNPGRTSPAAPARLKVLISAYACEPGRGSEPGVGWHAVVEAARRHDVWAITRTNNRHAIEAALAQRPMPTLHMVYYDLPPWARWWKRGSRGIRSYYYLWQLGLYRVARELHREVGFDVSHHVTFVKYWMPSLLPLLPPPCLWGPVGGGESAPSAFQVDSGWEGRVYELLRSVARWMGEHDPLVVAAARQSALAIAVTEQTAHRLRALGATRVEVGGESGLSSAEQASIRALEPAHPEEPIRFLSLGNLLHLKGFQLGLRAFAAARIAGTEYWLVGDGPYRGRLERLVRELGIEDRVTFWGALSRTEALARLAKCHVLVHPSLHDSGGWVCLEAMAAGKPVVCLDLGGPGLQVTPATGFKIAAERPDQAVRDLTRALETLAHDSDLRGRMGLAGRDRVASQFTWEVKGELVSSLYHRLAGHPANRRGALRAGARRD